MQRKCEHKAKGSSSRSVGYNAIDIRFVLGDNGKSLSYEFVGDSDHGELAGFTVLPEPVVSLPAFIIEPAGGPCGNIEEPSSVCVSVPVDVPPYVYGSSELLVSGADAEVSGELLGILEGREAASGNDESRCECYLLFRCS